MAVSIPPACKAVLYDKTIPEGMRLVDNAPVPSISASEVLVKVHSAAINPVDYKLPHIFPMSGRRVGLDFSGEVVQVGKSVSHVQVGDTIFGIGKGTLAEYCAADASKVAKSPKSGGFDDAAALPTAYLTSYQALYNNGLKAGARVLLIGASGGCGLAGLQVAKAAGAHVVAVCSARNVPLVKGMGADDVIDYTQQPLPAALAAAAAKFDIIYDTVSSPDDHLYEPEARPHLADGGRYVAINSPGALDWARSLLRRATGFNLQRRGYDLTITNHSRADLESLAGLADAGSVKPVIDTVLGFDQDAVRAGFERLKSRRTVGKIIFRPGGVPPTVTP